MASRKRERTGTPLANRLFSKRVAVLSLFLVAINSLHIKYSFEARPYTLFTFFGLAAAYFLILLTQKRTWYIWGLFILTNLLGIYTHYSYFFILASFVV